MRASKTTLNILLSIFLTGVSRLIGFFRSIVEIHLLGLGSQADSYQAAFRLTNFFRELFGEGALGNVFTPKHAQIRSLSETKAHQFFLATLLLVAVISGLMTVFLFLSLGFILPLWLNQFNQTQIQTTKDMLALMLPYLFCIATGSILMIFQQIQSRFGYSNIHPILFSLAIIVLGFWNPVQDVGQSLALGVLAGGLGQLGLLLFTTRIPRPNWKTILSLWPEICSMIPLILPVLFSLAVARLNRLIDLQFASGLQEGSISSLTYSQIILYVPLGLVAVAASSVIFPLLAKAHAQKKQSDFENNAFYGLDILIVLGLPLALFFTVYAKEIVTLLFVRLPELLHLKALSSTESQNLMSGALQYSSPALLALCLSPFLIRLFHSRLDTKTPAVLAIFLLFINVSLNVWLTPLLQSKGIALAATLTYFVQTVFLLILLCHQKIIPLPWQLLQTTALCSLIASFSLALSLYVPDFLSPIPQALVYLCVYLSILLPVKSKGYAKHSQSLS